MLIYRKVKMISQPKKTSRQYTGYETISREDYIQLYERRTLRDYT
jgi:hypothetical protein